MWTFNLFFTHTHIHILMSGFDGIPIQVFHLWAKSFGEQPKKWGFHAKSQFEFSSWWPAVVNMCLALHLDPLDKEVLVTQEVKHIVELKSQKVPYDAWQICSHYLLHCELLVQCSRVMLIYCWQDWKGGRVGRIYRSTDFDATHSQRIKRHSRPKWSTPGWVKTAQ